MGRISKIAGPLVVAEGMKGSGMYDVVRVGHAGLIGEIIQLDSDNAIIQVYEDTSGIRPLEPVASDNAPLSVELGPGLLSKIFDGVQRPLDEIEARTGSFISKGVNVPALDKRKRWHFHKEKNIARGAHVSEGMIIGRVDETGIIKHYIMVPYGIEGRLTKIREGSFTITDTIATVATKKGAINITMMQKRAVRIPGKYVEKMRSDTPLITGMRVVDLFFPVAKGGAAGIPGGFGTGKTVALHEIAKRSDTNIVVYIGCGERGNEMTEVLTDFPKLTDPKTGRPLMERTVLIANTSNMPVAARESSVYTGITIAEYFRDMGYDVALMADSTSRWAEAMREISARLEEMPGEEGYPAYLPKRIAEFYERAGRVKALCGRTGSITVIGAVSPPGGDISEPVSQGTLRVVKTFWALDAALANSRHFPSINWIQSYSLYTSSLLEWYKENVGDDFNALRFSSMRLLQKEAELKDIVQLVGADALPDHERLTLEIGRMIREYFLRQNAFDDVDAFTSLNKQRRMLEVIMHFREKGESALEKGVSADRIISMRVKERISRMRELKESGIDKEAQSIAHETDLEFEQLMKS